MVTPPAKATFELGYSGQFSLEQVRHFLEGFTPSPVLAGDGASLDFGFCAERSWKPVAVSITQDSAVDNTGSVRCVMTGEVEPAAARQQVERILSLDIAADDFADTCASDPLVGAMQVRVPGLRPPCFWTPYEAAAWAVISQRVPMVRATAIKTRLAVEAGPRIGGQVIFPAPQRLLEIEKFGGLNATKIDRLHAVAEAALEGNLDSARLRSMAVDDALGQLQTISGIGPFSAELIALRGAGHPDLFPRHEKRLHGIMRAAYGQPEATVDEMAQIAERWRPYRSWVSFLWRSQSGKAVSAK